ncbi:hypothetical protein DSCA_34880 [Desulfosarcina alkanivorans]|uniref:Uncharacterized protein n=1 Tax=Desulfosarcina alkanivorans TaxID=571177 RepID=A0A5K7YL69_9BACT|nr:hypothetical protein DSCA_34880 [Desulfosarcina alkanivorans]
MRENRTHGSEGGEGDGPSRPLSKNDPVLISCLEVNKPRETTLYAPDTQ